MFVFQESGRKASQDLGNIWHTFNYFSFPTYKKLVNGACLSFVIDGDQSYTVQDWKNLYQIHLAGF